MIYNRCRGCRKLTPKQQAQYNKALIDAYKVSRSLGSTSQEAKELGEKAKKILINAKSSQLSGRQA